ncbi:MAG: hypothetical protein KAS32_30685, partial [Candidatus Peribacteraceae bacterium]|nr:hypothetical protein [Candidatus Peribacteraceae bacterium]
IIIMQNPGYGQDPNYDKKQPTPAPINSPKEKSHKWLYIVGIVIVVAILTIAGFYVMSIMQFSDDSSSEENLLFPDRCGNGVCNLDETIESCPSDCTETPDDPEPTGPIMLLVSPSQKSVNSGETFTLDVLISNAYDVSGFQFKIEYDSGVLEFQDAEEGTFLNNNGDLSTFCVPHIHSEGLVENIACAILGQDSVEGEGVIETLTFKAVSSGSSDIKITNAKIANSDADKIESTITDGEVTVS